MDEIHCIHSVFSLLPPENIDEFVNLYDILSSQAAARGHRDKNKLYS
jgi:hypothetical protein